MTAPDRGDRIDRYIRGELSPTEARELAQESLDNPELFEELTYSAVANKAIAAGVETGRVIRFWRPGRSIIAGSVAAAIVVAFGFALRMRTPARIAPSTMHASGLRATLDSGRGADEPVLLAAGLPAGPKEHREVFRGAEPESRLPKSSGEIVAMEGQTAAIDLGSVDGLIRGTELDVYRDGAVVGRLRVGAVFRVRARAASDGRVRAHDEVRVPAAVHLIARMEGVHALAAGGDLAGARAAAENAVQWAGSAGVPAQSQVAAWNTLAVLRLLQSDRGAGEVLLRQALAACPPGDVSYAQILNNLGVIAELTGDKTQARQHYDSALQALRVHPEEAQVRENDIRTNLTRVAR